MIGTRIVAAVALGATVFILGGGAPRPEVRIVADATVEEAASRVLAGVNELEAALLPAMEAGRTGSARAVAGTADAAAPFRDAATAMWDALDEADVLHAALDDLEAARLARSPGAGSLPGIPDRGELSGIASQLEGTADAAAAFAQARGLAETATASMVAALDAAAIGDPEEAQDELRLALVAVDALRPYGEASPALTVWIGTADAMIDAMQRLVDAVRARDADRAERAEADFARAAEGAAEADRALRIGIGEAGSAVASAPLGRLAAALDALGALEMSVRADSAR